LPITLHRTPIAVHRHQGARLALQSQPVAVRHQPWAGGDHYPATDSGQATEAVHLNRARTGPRAFRPRGPSVVSADGAARGAFTT